MREQTIALARWLGGRRMAMPLTARLLCAGTVRESVRFFARELTRPAGAHPYRLRANGLTVAVRHQGPDAATLAEVFYHRYYEPPPELAGELAAPARILDLGANIGLFGAFAAARWPRARIVAYEPDPANALLLERAIAANRLASRWRAHRAAVGASDREVRFAAGLNVDSHVLAAGPPQAHGAPATIAARLHDVLDELADADLVKMDIEGGEWEILGDPRFAAHPPRCLVLEYHPRGCPSARPRDAVLGLLAEAGLRTHSIWDAPDGHGMLWAWRS
jgi:FkbM family methyltransferase